MIISTTKREIAWIIIAILVMGFIISFSLSPNYEPRILLISAIIILTSVITKKIAGYHFNIKVEHTVLEFKRWGYYIRSHFNNAIPMGLILPFFFSIISLGMIKPFTFLQFNSENLYKRRIRFRRGEREYRRTEINETDVASAAAWGSFALLILALIATIIKQPELAKYSIYYGIWNLIPFGNLDGMKLFFGSLVCWSLLAIIYIISLIVVLV